MLLRIVIRFCETGDRLRGRQFLIARAKALRESKHPIRIGLRQFGDNPRLLNCTAYESITI